MEEVREVAKAGAAASPLSSLKMSCVVPRTTGRYRTQIHEIIKLSGVKWRSVWPAARAFIVRNFRQIRDEARPSPLADRLPAHSAPVHTLSPHPLPTRPGHSLSDCLLKVHPYTLAASSSYLAWPLIPLSAQLEPRRP